MVPWSDNVRSQPSFLHPKKIDHRDFNPVERSFPFCTTANVGVVKDTDEGRVMRMLREEDSKNDAVRTRPFVEIGEDYVVFRMQRGPIKEHGINGCQIDDIVKFAADTIAVLNKKFPCRENALAITKLEEAWLWLKARTLDRDARYVEGLDKE